MALIGRNLTNKRIDLGTGLMPLATAITANQGAAYAGNFDRPRNIALSFTKRF